jgi:hypothetical protein
MAIPPETLSDEAFQPVPDHGISDLCADGEPQPSRTLIIRASYDHEMRGMYFLSPAR